MEIRLFSSQHYCSKSWHLLVKLLPGYDNLSRAMLAQQFNSNTRTHTHTHTCTHTHRHTHALLQIEALAKGQACLHMYMREYIYIYIYIYYILYHLCRSFWEKTRSSEHHRTIQHASKLPIVSIVVPACGYLAGTDKVG